MPTREEALAELYKRGALNDQQSQAVEELARRGVVSLEGFKQTPEQIIASETEGGGILDEIGGAVETAGSFLSSALAEPIAGIGGLAKTITSGPEAGAETVRQIQEGLTYNPRTPEGIRNLEAIGGSGLVQAVGRGIQKTEKTLGDMGYDVAGPIGGAIGATIPTAIMEAVGTLAPPALAARRAGRVGKQFEDVAEGARRQLPSSAPTEEGVRAIADIADKPRQAEQLAQMAQPDPMVLKAAEDLGFDEIPPAVATSNPQFRELSMALASVTGKSSDDFNNFITDISQKADDLIVEAGGLIDKNVVSEKFRNQTNRTIDTLSNQIDDVYKNVINKTIPGSTKVNVDGLRSFVDQQIENAGGFDRLSGDMKKLANLVYKKKGKKLTPYSPTYGNFEAIRKNIGQARTKKTGVFSDAEEGELKNMYRNVKDQQKNIAKEFGFDNALADADALSIKKYALQDTFSTLLGKNLSKDLLPVVGTRLKTAAKGAGLTEFKQLIDKVPKEIRGEVVSTAFNDIIGGGKNIKKQFDAPTFNDYMFFLERSPSTKKEIFKYLPEQTQKSLDNLYTLSNAMQKARDQRIPTGRVQTMFEINRPVLEKLIGFGGKATTFATAGKAAPVADIATDNIVKYLQNPDRRIQRANDLMSSSSFQKLMQNAVSDGVQEGNYLSRKTEIAEKALERSKVYKEWADTLSGSDKAKLASLGLTTFLLEPTEAENGR